MLIRNHRDQEQVLGPVRSQVDVEPFSADDALVAASLYPEVSAPGLSLGDRACLALAQRLDAPAVTADHAWALLSLDVAVRLVRPRAHHT